MGARSGLQLSALDKATRQDMAPALCPLDHVAALARMVAGLDLMGQMQRRHRIARQVFRGQNYKAKAAQHSPALDLALMADVSKRVARHMQASLPGLRAGLSVHEGLIRRLRQGP